VSKRADNHPVPSSRPALLIATAAAGSFLLSFVQSVPIPVLPQVGSELGVDAGAVGWVTTATLLAASSFTPLLGRIGHVLGIKPVFIAALVVTLVGSVLTATVSDLTWLVIGRVLQGASFGLFPLGISLLRHELPAQRLTSAMALVASTLGVGGGVALVAAGLLTRGGNDYRGAFMLSAALTALVLILAFMLPRRAGAGGKVDVLGALILSTGLVSLLLPISEGHAWGWGSPVVITLFAASAVILVAFVIFERRRDAPLISVEMLRRRPVLVTNLAAMVVGFAMFAQQLATSYFVQSSRALTGYGFSASTLEASLVFLLPGAAIGIIIGPLAGRLVVRIGARNVLAMACGIAAVACVSLALIHSNRTEFIGAFVVVSGGIAMAYAAMPALLVSYVDPAETGIANSVNSVLRTVGGTIGSALVVTILANQVGVKASAVSYPSEGAFQSSYFLSGAAFAIGLILSLAILPKAQDFEARRL
jgi:MFS family permease